MKDVKGWLGSPWLLMIAILIGGITLTSCEDGGGAEEEYEEVLEEPEQKTTARVPLSLNLMAGDSQSVYVQRFWLTQGNHDQENLRLGLWGVLKIITQVYESEWEKDSSLVLTGNMQYMLNIDPDGTLRMINEESVNFSSQRQLEVAHDFSRGIVSREIRFPAPDEYIQLSVIIGLKPDSRRKIEP